MSYRQLSLLIILNIFLRKQILFYIPYKRQFRMNRYFKRFNILAYQQTESYCPKCYEELFHLLQIYISSAVSQDISIPLTFISLLDQVMIHSLLHYPSSSLLHGRVKKIYKLLLTTGNTEWVECISHFYSVILQSQQNHLFSSLLQQLCYQYTLPFLLIIPQKRELPVTGSLLNICRRFDKQSQWKDILEKGHAYQSFHTEVDLVDIMKPLRDIDVSDSMNDLISSYRRILYVWRFVVS